MLEKGKGAELSSSSDPLPKNTEKSSDIQKQKPEDPKHAQQVEQDFQKVLSKGKKGSAVKSDPLTTLFDAKKTGKNPKSPHPEDTTATTEIPYTRKLKPQVMQRADEAVATHLDFSMPKRSFLGLSQPKNPNPLNLQPEGEILEQPDVNISTTPPLPFPKIAKKGEDSSLPTESIDSKQPDVKKNHPLIASTELPSNAQSKVQPEIPPIAPLNSPLLTSTENLVGTPPPIFAVPQQTHLDEKPPEEVGAFTVSSKGVDTPITQHTSPIQEAAPAKEIQKIVEQIVSKLYTIKTGSKVETSLFLKSPPLFEGVEIRLRQPTAAKSEINVEFYNLNAEAQKLIDSPENQKDLARLLAESGFNLRTVQTTHERSDLFEKFASGERQKEDSSFDQQQHKEKHQAQNPQEEEETT